MKIRRLLRAAALIAFALAAFGPGVTPARAVILGEDSFSYPEGSKLDGKSGGNFWNWKNSSDSAGAPGRVAGVSDWDDTSSGGTVSGGKFLTQGNSGVRREYNGPAEGMPITSDEGQGAINNFSNATLSFQEHVVYYRVTVTTGATLPDTMGLTSQDFATDRVFFGKTSNSSNFAVSDSIGSNLGGVTVLPNTTYTLVTKLDFVSGTASLFVNPNLKAAEPAATVTRSFDTSKWSTGLRLASTGTGYSPVAWDNLMVATAWANLAPIVVTTGADDNDASALNSPSISLREAVKHAPDDSLITFDPGMSGRTITLSLGQLSSSSSLTIDATNLPGGLTVDGNDTDRHFQVPTGKSLTLRGFTLTRGNAAADITNKVGGSILNAGQLRLDRCVLSGNRSPNEGGAVQSGLGTSLRATDCIFSGNFADNAGGAIRAESNLELTRCTFSGNTAGTGAAVFTQGVANLSRCTIAGNQSQAPNIVTAAIHAREGTANLTHCTLSQNTGNGNTGGAGLGLQFPAVVNLQYCLIAGNSNPHGKVDIFKAVGGPGTLNVTGPCLIGSNEAVESTFPAGTLAGTAAAPLDPRLLPLGSYGGLTPTMALRRNSPAINAATGSTSTADQRGTAVFGTPDIGAYEAPDPAPVLVTTAADEDNGSLALAAGGGSGRSLREAVKYAPADALITFASALSGQTITLTHADGDMPIPSALTIDALVLGGGLTVDANNTSRHFDVPVDKELTLRGLTLKRGNGQGGVFIDGGSIQNYGALRLERCTLTGNSSSSHGGAVVSFGTLQATGSTFSENSTTLTGGGINIFSGSVELAGCTISGNAAKGGGGIWLQGDHHTVLDHCTLSGNRATGSDVSDMSGGIMSLEGTLSLRHCTLTRNIGRSAGGGVFIQAPATVNLDSCLIAGNSNSNGIGPADVAFVGGTLNTTGANLIGSNQTVEAKFPAGPLVGTAAAPLDARPAPLGNYGGPTQTVALLAGSPALNAASGSPATTDQRGSATFGIPDLGAYEAATALSTVVTTPGDEDNGSADPAAGGGAGLSLREAVKYSTPGSLITFDPALSGQTITLTHADGRMIVPSALIIDATGLAGGLILDGNQTTRHFEIPASQYLELRGLSLTRGRTAGSAQFAGGSIFNSGALVLDSCAFSRNEATSGSGGALFLNFDASLRATATSFSSNNADSRGGAVTMFGNSTALLSRCTLDSNLAPSGGALWLEGSPAATLDHCTIAHNNAIDAAGILPGGPHAAGGIGINGGTLTVNHCTLSRNIGRGGGGGLLLQSPGTLHLSNSILAGNSDDRNAPADLNLVSGTLDPAGPCLLGTNRSVEIPFPTGPFAGTDDAPINPQLSFLGNHGGPTWTLPPLPGSPARDALTSATTDSSYRDQRGYPQFGVRDLGAYEAQLGPITDLTTPANRSIDPISFFPGQVGTLSASSSNTILLSNSNLSLSGTAAAQSLSLNPTPDQTGVTTIRITDPGTGDYTEFTLTVTPPENRNPVAAADTLTRYPTQGVKVPIATLLANDSDPDNDLPLTLTTIDAASAHGGTVTSDSTTVFYTPAPGFKETDTFTYTLSDGKGGTATGTVTINLVTDNSKALNLTTLQLQPDGSMIVGFAAIPGRTYQIQTSEDLQIWTTRATLTADTHGAITFTDPPPLPVKRYYRTVQP